MLQLHEVLCYPDFDLSNKLLCDGQEEGNDPNQDTDNPEYNPEGNLCPDCMLPVLHDLMPLVDFRPCLCEVQRLKLGESLGFLRV